NGATVAAMQDAAPTPAPIQPPTHGPKTSELAAILADLGEEKIATVAEIAGADLWDPLWAALGDDSDPAAQEAAVAAGLDAVRERVESMPAAEKAEKLPALMGLGAPAWRLHALISK
ncbi:MAG: hypothetical protein KAT00_04000, partial [Planctomycetes bacterium]|nr:hypothetical protein [Planctomycetota bacterium]